MNRVKTRENTVLYTFFTGLFCQVLHSLFLAGYAGGVKDTGLNRNVTGWFCHFSLLLKGFVMELPVHSILKTKIYIRDRENDILYPNM